MSAAHRQSRHVVSGDLYRTQLGIVESLSTRQQVAAIYRDLPWPATAGRWVLWDDFVEVHVRLRQQPRVDDSALRSAGAAATSRDELPRQLSRFIPFADPGLLWGFFARTVLPRLAPLFEVEAEAIAPGHFIVHTRMAHDARACPDFFIASAGAFEHMCEVMGFGPASVTPVFHDPHHADFRFQCAPRRSARSVVAGAISRLRGIQARFELVASELQAVETEIASAVATTRRAEALGQLAVAAETEARRSVTVQRETFRTLNHAMRTPLNHIVASVSLLQEGQLTRSARAKLDEMDHHANAILEVLSELRAAGNGRSDSRPSDARGGS